MINGIKTVLIKFKYFKSELHIYSQSLEKLNLKLFKFEHHWTIERENGYFMKE